MKKKTALLMFWVLLFSLALPSFQVEAATQHQQIIWLDKGYDDVDPFVENRAVVIKGGKWGFIDLEGNEIIPLEYSWAGDFSDGRAPVCKGEYPYLQYGFIDLWGNEVVPLEYTWVSGFYEGLSQVQIGFYPEGKSGYIDRDGNTIVPLIYEDAGVFFNGLAPVKFNGFWGYIDHQGNTVVPFIYDEASYFFYEDYAQVGINKAEGLKYAFINTKGEEICEFKYDIAGWFSEGLAAVGQGFEDEAKFGYINTSGEEVIPLVYDWAEEFKEGVAPVSSNGLWSLINKEGQLLPNDKYDYIWPIQNGFHIVVTSNDKWGFINTDGQEIVPPIYDLADDFVDGLAKVGMVTENGYKFGFIDETGKIVLPLKYELLSNSFNQGLTNAMYEGRWGFIDLKGQVVIPFQFDDARPFSDDRAIVQIGDKFGILKHPSLSQPAIPTNSKILVDGKEVVFEAYLINDNNYFKLRDIAAVLSGSSKQFEVGWDNVNRVINLESNKPYTTVGGELALGDGKEKTAVLNTATIFKDGKEVKLIAYNIQGNNYFKLRDLGVSFDFGVEWDPITRNVMINSNSSYIE